MNCVELSVVLTLFIFEEIEESLSNLPETTPLVTEEIHSTAWCRRSTLLPARVCEG